MLRCGNNVLKQKAVDVSMTRYVHALQYNAAKQIVYLNALQLS
jgi:SRSO17 transposase